MYWADPLSVCGHVHLLTFIDHLTEWAYTYPNGNKSGATVALHNDYFSRYNLPEMLISNNIVEFRNSTVTNLHKAFDAKKK